MSDKNGATRVQLTTQELEVMRSLVCNKLRVKGTPREISETLGGILMKVGRASNRIKTQGNDK